MAQGKTAEMIHQRMVQCRKIAADKRSAAEANNRLTQTLMRESEEFDHEADEHQTTLKRLEDKTA